MTQGGLEHDSNTFLHLVFGSLACKVFIQCFQAPTSRTKTSIQAGLEPPSVASAKSSQTFDSNALSIRRLGSCQRQMLATKIDSNSSWKYGGVMGFIITTDTSSDRLEEEF